MEKKSIKFQKTCKCTRTYTGRSVTATVGAFRIQEEKDKEGKMVIGGIFIPGPSCDECGKEWEMLDS